MERQKLQSTLEIFTSIAVLLVAVAALSTFAISVFVKPATPNLRPGLERGKPFGQIANVDYRSNEQTLLIALNTNCSYCRESLPLYRTLSGLQHPSSKSLRIVALFPNKASEVAWYVKENQLILDTVAEVDFDSLHVSGTPTMILITKSGEVKDFWVGKLATPIAEEFIRSLTQTNRRSE